MLVLEFGVYDIRHYPGEEYSAFFVCTFVWVNKFNIKSAAHFT